MVKILQKSAGLYIRLFGYYHNLFPGFLYQLYRLMGYLITHEVCQGQV